MCVRARRERYEVALGGGPPGRSSGGAEQHNHYVGRVGGQDQERVAVAGHVRGSSAQRAGSAASRAVQRPRRGALNQAPAKARLAAAWLASLRPAPIKAGADEADKRAFRRRGGCCGPPKASAPWALAPCSEASPAWSCRAPAWAQQAWGPEPARASGPAWRVDSDWAAVTLGKLLVRFSSGETLAAIAANAASKTGPARTNSKSRDEFMPASTRE